MNSNTTQATAAGSYGAGGLIVTIVVWLLSLRGIMVPDQVALASGALIGYGIHWVSMVVIGRGSSGAGAEAPANAVGGASTKLTN